MTQELDMLEKRLKEFEIKIFAIESMVQHLLCLSIFQQTIDLGSPHNLKEIVKESENRVEKHTSERLQHTDGLNDLIEDIVAYQRDVFKRIKLTLENEIRFLRAVSKTSRK